jgi:hypothetical protein
MRSVLSGATVPGAVYPFAVAVFLWFGQTVSSVELMIDGVPIPDDAHVSAASQPASETQKRLLGAWAGAWGGFLRHILIVEDIRPDGEASVVYAIGDSPAANITRQWSRHKGTVSGDTLTLAGNFATYQLTTAEMLLATYQRGQGRSHATMTRIELAALTRPGATINWTSGEDEFLDTDLTEDGKRVRLEVVLFKPKGSGPFPLVVFNHGSTGMGRQPELFTLTWSGPPGLAQFFLEKGWMVAVAGESQMAYTMRGSRRTARRAIRAIRADRCRARTGRLPTLRQLLLRSSGVRMSPASGFSSGGCREGESCRSPTRDYIPNRSQASSTSSGAGKANIARRQAR